MNEAEKLFEKVKTLQLGEDIVEALTDLASSKSKTNYADPETMALIRSVGKVSSYSGMLEAFKRLLFTTPTVTLTLAFYPSKSLLARATKWFEDNLEERVLIDLRVDPAIVGGARIMCREHYRDFSIAGKMEEMGITKTEEQNTELPVATI